MSINLNTKKGQRLARIARYADALEKAHKAASVAQQGMTEGTGLDCGFAWVVTHDVGFNTWCRAMAKAGTVPVGHAAHGSANTYYGSKHHAAGWCFWKPGRWAGQSIGIHEAGARAFRDVLTHELQIRCDVGSRYD